jgi:Ca-activated chloride channel homolog
LNIRFEQPALLLIGLLTLPLIVLGLRTLASIDPVRKWTALVLRTALLLMLAVVLAGPQAVREHDRMTVIALVDVSGSVQRFAELPPVDETGRQSNVEYLRQWLREATDSRRPEDRVGIVAFDAQAIAIAAPTTGEYVDDNLDLPMMEGTNIAEAIRLGLAMFPADTARRLVLISDGNETLGNALDAARQAAASSAAGGTGGGAGGGAGRGAGKEVRSPHSIPIDVLPIDYHVRGDVQVVRIEAPPTAQPGQTVTVRIIMEATEPATGTLTLRREGIPVDLDSSRAGHGRRVALPAGQSVHLAQVTLGETPINRFVAAYEPDDPAQDLLPDNNRAEHFTATPSRGSVLIVSNRSAEDHLLAAILSQADAASGGREARLPVSVQPAQLLPHDLLSLQNYDLIVLDNIASYELSDQQRKLLAEYVSRLGGGLIMAGGEQGFGAGGWTRTAVADILPVELDPPRELRAPTAAIVLVIDRSGSMNRPVAGARASQQEVANEGAALAIESLRAETYIGVVAFDHTAEVFIPLQPNDNPSELADRVRMIRAMGGTRIENALRLAHRMVQEVDVQQRQIVLLTDGISHDHDMPGAIAMLAADGVRVTTIGVGDDIDRGQLHMIAEGTGGVFHHVRNPRILPRVLVDSVQEFNKPLLKEGLFRPVVRPTGLTLTVGMEDAPELGGLVITAPRDEPRVFLDMVHPDGEPLLAHWQVGLGRVAAFTSEIEGRWARRWIDWPGAHAFWIQLARTIARPPVSRETELIVSIEDDRLRITLEAAGEDGRDGGFLDYLVVEGSVYLPDGRSVPVRLRQVAPGRYEGDVPALQAGSYIVALSPRHGSRPLAPVIGGTSRATSEEYRRYTSSRPLIEEIASITGGRVLDMEQPRAVDLFDRRDMPPSVSSIPIWPTLLWLALALMMMDVACRRLAWDWPLIKWAIAAAMVRVTPARLRAMRMVATLRSLRRVSERMEHRQTAASAGVQKLRGRGSTEPSPPRIPRAKPQATPRAEKPDEAKVSAALNALLGRKPSSPSKPPVEPPVDDSESAKPSPAGETSRSSLLAAKRRAREKMQRPPGD